MNITRLEWANPEHTRVIVNGGESVVPWPCYTWHKFEIDSFLGTGGVILPAPSSEDDLWDGTQWVLDLMRVKARAGVDIDFAAGKTALRYITNRPGQEATYIYKATQARAHKAAAYPAELSAYPLIASELDALKVSNPAATAQMASDSILATEALWVAKSAQIESARRVGKEKVKVATTEADVRAARRAAISLLEML